MKKSITKDAYNCTVEPYATALSVSMTVEQRDLTSLLSDMDLDEIIDFVEQEGYKVEKEK